MRTKRKDGLVVAAFAWPEPERVPLSEVQFAPYNPRRMPPEKMRQLKASILKHGMVLNLVVQRCSEVHGSNVLIGGHQRIVAARELCREHCWPEPTHAWAVFRDCDDATAKQLNVALNNVGGEFDPHLLGLLLADVAPLMSADDFLAIGLGEENVDELIRSASRTPEEEAAELEREAVGLLSGFQRAETLTLEFADRGARDAAKVALVALTKESGKKAGDAMLDVLNAGKKPTAKPRGKVASAS
jgi:ParB-like chromosome segregation protein Spo0J